MSAKNYFDFEYDNKHIESVVSYRDLTSLYGLMDEYSEKIAIKYAIWYSEKMENRADFSLTEKEIFEWFKIDEQL